MTAAAVRSGFGTLALLLGIMLMMRSKPRAPVTPMLRSRPF